jgi:Reverse transcriptase (RNA-dependent DNA polymerase).
MIGELDLSLYGTRDAAQNWTIEHTSFLESLGFAAGTATPCQFRHKARKLSRTVHGDDCTVTGPTSELQWLST